jgi:tetratricopeptide (TPR) repeat protein
MQSLHPSTKLDGQRVSFTGRGLALNRPQAAKLVNDHGGEYCRNIDDRTTLLIIGAVGWPLQKNGRLTRKLDEATRLKKAGHRIQIESEADFLERLGDRSQPSRRFTLPQLSRILDISPQKLLAWRRIEWLQPVEAEGGIEWYDFQQVTRCRTLTELTKSSVSMTRFRRALKQLHHLDVESAVFLDRLVRCGSHFAIRDAKGGFFQPSGQRLFVFEEEPETISCLFASPLNVTSQLDDEFERAVTHEVHGQFEQAEELYRTILVQNPGDCDALYNLGNVLIELEKFREAAEWYQEALALDPSFLEAWANLGNVQIELREFENALNSFQSALTLWRSYPTALYGMACALEGCGKIHQARRYWQAFLRVERDGEYAAYAQRRLLTDAHQPI